MDADDYDIELSFPWCDADSALYFFGFPHNDDMARPFKPYGSPPPLDLDEYKDSLELWEAQWLSFLFLSTIDTALDAAERAEYKTQMLKSCLSVRTLQMVLSMGLTANELASAPAIIAKLKDRCNAGRNHHVWRQQFATSKQRPDQAVDDWLCEIRELATKCCFATDCCANCEETRILGQIVFGVQNDDIRCKLLEERTGLTLARATAMLRTAEVAAKQSNNITTGTSFSVRTTYSSYKRNKTSNTKPNESEKQSTTDSPSSPAGYWYCGAEERHPKTECPATGKECNHCKKIGHFSKVCKQKAKKRINSVAVSRTTKTMAMVPTTS